MKATLSKLNNTLEGDLHFDSTILKLYATDASAYREIPLAVSFPKSKQDIQKLIRFANENNTSHLVQQEHL